MRGSPKRVFSFFSKPKTGTNSKKVLLKVEKPSRLDMSGNFLGGLDWFGFGFEALALVESKWNSPPHTTTDCKPSRGKQKVRFEWWQSLFESPKKPYGISADSPT